MKSSVDEIRQRFDADVERFSNLQTGQSATVDAPLAMALVAQAAAATMPHVRHVLDVGCGAGNYTLKLLEHLPNLDVTLIDLSQSMLERATQRIKQATTGRIKTIQGDLREVELSEGAFDIVRAATVLHTCGPTRSGRMSSHLSTGRYGPVVPFGSTIWSRVPCLRSKN